MCSAALCWLTSRVYTRTGLGVVYPDKGIAALAAALSAAPAAWRAQHVASPFDWPKLMAGATHVFPLFSEHAGYATSPPAGASTAAAAGKSARTVRGQRRGVSAVGEKSQPARKQDAAEVQAVVAEVVAGMLGAAVDPAQPLMEAGLDSIGVQCYMLLLREQLLVVW